MEHYYSQYTSLDGYVYFTDEDLEDGLKDFFKLSYKYWNDYGWTSWLLNEKITIDPPTPEELIEIRDAMYDSYLGYSKNHMALVDTYEDQIDSEVVDFYIENGKLRYVSEALNGEEFCGDWQGVEFVPVDELFRWKCRR